MDTTPLQKFVDDNRDSSPTLILKLPNTPDTVFVPTPIVVTPSIDSLVIHEIASGRLTPLTSTIDLNLFSPFNIQANCTNTASVLFVFDGKKYPVEGMAPFCIGGDDKPLDVKAGDHVISVLAYAGPNATGLAVTQTVNFTATAGGFPVNVLPPLVDGMNLDLKGGTCILDKQRYAPSGTVSIRNGTIKYAGNGGVVGSDGMACFVIPDKAKLSLEHVRFEIPKKVEIARVRGGSVDLSFLSQSSGGLLHGSGGEFVSITHCETDSPPDKYWFCNFDKLLKVVRIDNTGCKPIPAGDNESPVRLMQIDDYLAIGLEVTGNKPKQSFADRPGGSPGSNYKIHRWVNCKAPTADLGNIKLVEDPNFPYGRLALSVWENCSIGKLTRTDQGANPLSPENMGIKKIMYNGKQMFP